MISEIPKKIKLAYLVTHPIQYQAPLLRRIAALHDVDLKVFFLSDFSTREFRDIEFERIVQWDVPLLDGYNYEFLPALGAAERIGRIRPLVYGLSRRLQDGQFDALWIHGWAHWSHVWAVLAAKRLGIRVLVRGEPHLRLRNRNRFKEGVKRHFLGWLFPKVDAFLAIGSLNRDFYLHYGVAPEKIFMVPYAVDNDFFQTKANDASKQREDLRFALGLQRGRPIILYASKLTERKRPQDLLEAYVRLSPDGRAEPPAYLLFVGDGEMRDQLQRRAQSIGWSSIRFLGFKNQTELPAYYDLCDVFVLPSVNEPWGLVINEAMNAGKAIIVSNEVGSGADLVRDGINGFVFRSGDIHALQLALAQVLANQNYDRMGEASRNIISTWSFNECLAGLRQALVDVTVAR